MLVACRSPSPPAAIDSGPAPSAKPASTIEATAPAGRPWLELYVAPWAMPARLDLANVSDVVLFGLVPSGNDLGTGQLTSEKIEKVTRAAREAKVPVLACIGGEKTGPLFEDAGDALASALARFVAKHSLEGVVLDIEPLAAVSPEKLAAFVRALRKARTMRIEAVVAPDEKEIARLAPIATLLDRVAIMSYLGRGNERAMVERLRAMGIPPMHIGLGVDKQTVEHDRAARIESAKRGTTGGLIVWHAATVSSVQLGD